MQIGIDNRMPLFQAFILKQRRLKGDARVIDQNIHMPKPLHHLFCSCLGVSKIRYITFYKKMIAAILL